MIWVILKEYALLLEEICFLFLFFQIEIKKEKKDQLLFLCFLIIIAILHLINIPDNLITFMIFEILDFISFSIIVKLPAIKKITYYFLAYFICGTIEMLVMWIIIKETSSWNNIINGEYNLFQLRIVLVLLLYVIGKMRLQQKKTTTYSIKIYWYISLIACLFGTFLGGFLFVETPKNIDDKKIILHFSIISLGIILIINTAGILLMAVRRKADKERIDLQNELLHIQKKYYNQFNEKQIILRKMQHDMKAHLILINKLNQNNDSREIQNYLNKLLFESERYSYSDYDTGNKIATIMINYFADLSKEYNILFEYEGRFEDRIKITEFEINSLLYNVLNNAYEECIRLSDDISKKIYISIKNLNRTLMITVSNSCRNDISPEAMIDVGTLKKNKENHGYGIKIIKSIVENYDGEINFICNEGVWTVEMIFLDIYN